MATIHGDYNLLVFDSVFYCCANQKHLMDAPSFSQRDLEAATSYDIGRRRQRIYCMSLAHATVLLTI
jgi:hypothetical protein